MTEDWPLTAMVVTLVVYFIVFLIQVFDYVDALRTNKDGIAVQIADLMTGFSDAKKSALIALVVVVDSALWPFWIWNALKGKGTKR